MFRGSIVNFFSQWPVPVFLRERFLIFQIQLCFFYFSYTLLIKLGGSYLLKFFYIYILHIYWNYVLFFIFASFLLSFFFSFVYNNVWVDFCCLFQSIKRIAWHQTVTRIAASIPINLWLWRVGVDTLLLRWNISFSNVLFLIALFRTVHNNCFFINFVVIKEII